MLNIGHLLYAKKGNNSQSRGLDDHDYSNISVWARAAAAVAGGKAFVVESIVGSILLAAPLRMNIEFMIELKDYDESSKLIIKIALWLIPACCRKRRNCDSQQALWSALHSRHVWSILTKAPTHRGRRVRERSKKFIVCGRSQTRWRMFLCFHT